MYNHHRKLPTISNEKLIKSYFYFLLKLINIEGETRILLCKKLTDLVFRTLKIKILKLKSEQNKNIHDFTDKELTLFLIESLNEVQENILGNFIDRLSAEEKNNLLFELRQKIISSTTS